MWIDYGTVRLKIVDLLRYDRENIYTPDRQDLLTVRTTIGVAATYAPNGDPRMPSVRVLSPDTRDVLTGDDKTRLVTQDNVRANNPGITAQVFPAPSLETDQPTAIPITPSQWLSGPQTDAELRYRLALPRQRLVIWAYDRQTGNPIRWLESPRPGFVCDATGGPFVLGNPVISTAGEPHSVAVYFEVQTDMIPCPTGSDRLILSHRWQMRHAHDENFYMTRVIDGEIIFNAAYVHTYGIRPDSVRNQFIHPIPLGFRRGVPVVTQSSDGLTIRYTVTDTDPTIMFSAGDSGATQIDIQERVVYNVPFANGGEGRNRDRSTLQRLADPFDVYGYLRGRN